VTAGVSPPRRGIGFARMGTTMRTTRTLALAALLLCLTLLAAAPAWAQRCDLRIRDLQPVQTTSVYDPYGPAPPRGFHTFAVELMDGNACDFIVGIDDGENGSSNVRRMADGGGRLNYELWVDGNLRQRLTDPVTGSAAGTFSGKLNGKKNDRVEFQFYSTINGGQAVGAGSYRDRVTFRVYSIQGNGIGEVVDIRTVEVSTHVAAAVQANVVVGGISRQLDGSTSMLDFGQMQSGAARSFDLEVSGNSGYSVTVQSDNGGRFMDRTRSQGVPYTLSVNGASVRLDRPVSLSYGGGYGRHQMTVTLGDVSQALAGDYSDSLVVTVSAR